MNQAPLRAHQRQRSLDMVEVALTRHQVARDFDGLIKLQRTPKSRATFDDHHIHHLQQWPSSWTTTGQYRKRQNPAQMILQLLLLHRHAWKHLTHQSKALRHCLNKAMPTLWHCTHCRLREAGTVWEEHPIDPDPTFALGDPM